jgi:mannose-6-phosphate isomerase
MGITHAAYLGGLCDMTGELVRLARSRPERAEAIARDVADLYGRAVGMVVMRNSKVRAKLQDLERNLVRLEEIVYASGRRPGPRTAESARGLPAGTREGEKLEEHRPWGFFTILSDAKDCKVKRITVFPGQRLSLQRHRRRGEHWHVFRGRGVVTLDDREIGVEPGRSVDIPRGSFHRIRNAGDGNLVLIEVQTGDYFGEDDIERVEDDYGRA